MSTPGPSPIGRSRAAAIAAHTLALFLLSTAPAWAGPPWISVEYPPNPHDPASRGALVLVHAYHHQHAMPFPVSATAEGLVNGERRSVPLRVAETSRGGVYAVRGDVPGEGAWVLVVNMTDTEARVRASALVALGPDREVTAVEVPHREEGRWWIPRAATDGDVDAMLRTAVAMARARREVAESPFGSPAKGLLLAGLALAVPAGLTLRRRARA